MKRFDIKKLLFLLIVIALIFTVAACSKPVDNNTGGNNNNNNNNNNDDDDDNQEQPVDVMKVLEGLLVGAGNLLNEVGTNGQNDFYAEAKLALNIDIAAVTESGTKGTESYVAPRDAFKLDGALRIAGIVSKTKTNTVGIEVLDNNCTVNGGVRFGIYMEYIPGTTEQTTFYLATNFASASETSDAASLYKFKNLNEIPFDKVSEIINLFVGTEEEAGLGETLTGLSSTVSGLYSSIEGMSTLVGQLIEAGAETKINDTNLYQSALKIKFSGLGGLLSSLNLDLTGLLGDFGSTLNPILDDVLGFNLSNLGSVTETSDVADLSIVTTVDKTTAATPILRGLMINYDFNGIKVGAGIENVFVKAYNADANIITGKANFDDGAVQVKVNLDVPGLTGTIGEGTAVPFYAGAVLTATGSSDNNDDNNAVAEVYLYNNAAHDTVIATLGVGTYKGAEDALYFDISGLVDFLGVTATNTKYKMTLDIREEIVNAISQGYEVILNGDSKGRYTADDSFGSVYRFDTNNYKAVEGDVVVKLNGTAVTPDQATNGIYLSEDKSYMTIEMSAFVPFADAALGAENAADPSKRVLTITVAEPDSLYDTVWTYGKVIDESDLTEFGLKKGDFFKVLFKNATDPEATYQSLVKTVEGKPIQGTYYVNTEFKADCVLPTSGLYDIKLVTYPGEKSAKEFSYTSADKAGYPTNITAGTANCAKPVIDEFTVKVETEYDLETGATLLASDFGFENVYFDYDSVAYGTELVKLEGTVGGDGYGLTFLADGEYTITVYHDAQFDASGVVESSLKLEKSQQINVKVSSKLDIFGLVGVVMDAYNAVKDAVDAKNASAKPFSAFGDTLKISFVNEIIDFVLRDPAIFNAIYGVANNEIVTGIINLDEMLSTFYPVLPEVTANTGDDAVACKRCGIKIAKADADGYCAACEVLNAWTIEDAIEKFVTDYNASLEEGEEAIVLPTAYTVGGIAAWALGNWGYEVGDIIDDELSEGDEGYGETYTTNLYDDILTVIDKLVSSEAKTVVGAATLTAESTKADKLAVIATYVDALEFGVVDGSITEQQISGKAADVFYGELFAGVVKGENKATVIELGGSFAIVSKSYITTKLAETAFATPADGFVTVLPEEAATIGTMFLDYLLAAVGLEQEVVG